MIYMKGKDIARPANFVKKRDQTPTGASMIVT